MRVRIRGLVGPIALSAAALVGMQSCGSGEDVNEKSPGGTTGNSGKGGASAGSGGGTAGSSGGNDGSGTNGGVGGMTGGAAGTGNAGGGAGSSGSDGAAGSSGSGGAVGSELKVVSVEPTARGLRAALDGAIVVHFDRPLAKDSVTPKNFWAFGRWGGPMDGEITFADGDKAVSLKPRRRFTAGDRVSGNFGQLAEGRRWDELTQAGVFVPILDRRQRSTDDVCSNAGTDGIGEGQRCGDACLRWIHQRSGWRWFPRLDDRERGLGRSAHLHE